MMNQTLGFGFHVVPECQTEDDFDHSAAHLHSTGEVCECPCECVETVEALWEAETALRFPS